MRKFFYLMAMVCTLGFFTACSSDDDPTIWDTYQGGTYDVWFESLDIASDDLVDVDNELVDLKMKISKVDDTKAKVVITSSATSYTITIPEALIMQQGDTVVVTGTGKSDMPATTTKATASTSNDVTLTAKISKDNNVKLAMKWGNLNINAITEPKGGFSDLIGTWDTWAKYYDSDNKEVEGPDDENFEYALGSIKFNWETPEGTIINIPMDPSTPDFVMPLPAESAAQLAERLANKDFTNALKSVSFTTDGKIYAVYSDEENNGVPTWKVAKEYATYKEISDNLLDIYLNNDLICSTVKDATEKALLKTILTSIEDKDGAITVNVEYSKDGKSAFFYVDKDFAAELVNNTVLQGLLKNVKNEDFNNMGFMIKAIAGQIPDLMNKTTKFQVGVELLKR